jgi:ABC-2 type transport system permease protein
LGIVIPKKFAEDISGGRTAPVQFIVDGSDGNAGSITIGYVQSVVRNYSVNAAVNYLKRKGRINYSQPLEAETRVWFNPLLKTRIYMVPAIVGLLLSIITIILTSLAIVKEKEIGTLEQLIVTPIKPYQMILGKLLPFLLLGFVSVGIILTAMVIIFGIPIKGSVAFLLLASFAFVLSTLGLGLFVSTVTKTQQQAMMIAIFVIMMPMIYLSGFAFPIENMPDFIQLITYIIPLRYFITIIRGVILKGLGFAELWHELLILFLFGTAILYFSSLRFKKKID